MLFPLLADRPDRSTVTRVQETCEHAGINFFLSPIKSIDICSQSCCSSHVVSQVIHANVEFIIEADMGLGTAVNAHANLSWSRRALCSFSL